MKVHKLQEHFDAVTRHYLGNSTLMLLWGVVAVYAVQPANRFFLYPLALTLIVWIAIVIRWSFKNYPIAKKEMIRFLLVGMAKYGAAGVSFGYFLHANMLGLVSFTFIVIILLYIYDAIHLNYVLDIVQKDM